MDNLISWLFGAFCVLPWGMAIGISMGYKRALEDMDCGMHLGRMAKSFERAVARRSDVRVNVPVCVQKDM